jgi:hypothetical protein
MTNAQISGSHEALQMTIGLEELYLQNKCNDIAPKMFMAHACMQMFNTIPFFKRES